MLQNKGDDVGVDKVASVEVSVGVPGLPMIDDDKVVLPKVPPNDGKGCWFRWIGVSLLYSATITESDLPVKALFIALFLR